jgi:hypothetical protein
MEKIMSKEKQKNISRTVPKGCFLIKDKSYGYKWKPIDKDILCNDCEYYSISPNKNFGRCKKPSDKYLELMKIKNGK